MRTILVVDDSEIVLESAQSAFASAGFEVVVTSDSSSVAARLRDCNADLVLLDIDMPGASGPEVLRGLRGQPEFDDTRMILFSGHGGGSLLSRMAWDCGADGMVGKADSAERLVECVRPFLKRPSELGLLARRRAVVVATPRLLDAGVTTLLAELGVISMTWGAIGVDRALRKRGVHFLIVEEEAFGAGFGQVLTRLQRRGLLATTAVLVIHSEAQGADACLAGELTLRTLEETLLQALAALAKRAAPGA